MCATLDALTLTEMFLGGTEYLNNKKEVINELNVFPVPDGDTGTNMTLTLMNAARDLASAEKTISINDFCRKVSSGTLRSARGNSGVIMSQLCRGFAEQIKDARDVGKELLTQALENAAKTAYSAVLNPVEGTMLTVARAAAEKARELLPKNLGMKEFLSGILEYARTVLKKTPEMLPVLKEAGVVDSGGQGLVEFMTGAYDSITSGHQNTSEHHLFNDSSENNADPASVKGSSAIDVSSISTSDIKYIYCTEFIITLTHANAQKEESQLRSFLGGIGDSVVCVGMENLIKVHVHTNHPGQVIERALECGELSSLKIDNMRIEHNERVITYEEKNAQVSTQESCDEQEENCTAEPAAEYGFISVCSGDGISEIYKNLGTDVVIDGGQTMNPSTEDFLRAIENLNAKNIYILPNNSNIIMAAQQAKELLSEKNIIVIPSVNICQGINALIGFDGSLSAQKNEQGMLEAMEAVKYVEVTYAVRNTRINGQDVAKGDYMGISGSKCLAVCADPEDAACHAVEQVAYEDPQLITVYYGKGVSEERLKKLEETFNRTWDADIEMAYGGQKVYDYIISVD